MNAHQRSGADYDKSDRVSEYVAELVAAAPPISADVRAKLADLLAAPVAKKGVA